MGGSELAALFYFASIDEELPEEAEGESHEHGREDSIAGGAFAICWGGGNAQNGDQHEEAHGDFQHADDEADDEVVVPDGEGDGDEAGDSRADERCHEEEMRNDFFFRRGIFGCEKLRENQADQRNDEDQDGPNRIGTIVVEDDASRCDQDEYDANQGEQSDDRGLENLGSLSGGQVGDPRNDSASRG